MNNAWNEQAKVSASDEHQGFGRSVAIDGDTLIVGATGNAPNFIGAAYIFVRDQNNNWNQQAKISGSDSNSMIAFGISVDIDQDTAIVGTSSDVAYIFERDQDGNWRQQVKLLASDRQPNVHSYFGSHVAVEGDTAIVGAHDDGDNGSAYIYSRDMSGIWIELTKLVPHAGGDYQRFVFSVAIEGDTAFAGDPNGNRAFGRENIGSAYIWKRRIM